MKTIFDPAGELQVCPRCGGTVEIVSKYVLRGAPATNDAAVTEFVCLADDCGRGRAFREKVSWMIYWENRERPWFIFRPDTKPWGKQ